MVVAENIEIAGLRRFKDDVTEVREGFECGINLGSFNDLQIGDLIADVRDAGEAARLIAHLAVAWLGGTDHDWSPGSPLATRMPRRHRRKADSDMADPARARKIADRIKVLVAETLEHRRQGPAARLHRPSPMSG